MIIKTLRQGFRKAIRIPGILILFWAANLVTAYLINAPFQTALKATTESSLLADRLAAGLDMNLLIELFQVNRGLAAATGRLALVLGLFYLIAGVFISAGAFEVLRPFEERKGFWSGAAKHFWPFLRVFIWMIPFVVLMGVGLFLADLIRKAVVGADPLQSTAFWSTLSLLALAFLGLFCLTLIADYARAFLVARDEKRARKAVWESVRFILGHPVKTGGFLLFVFLLSGIISVLMNWVAGALGVLDSNSAIGLFLVGQALVLIRLFLRFTRYAGTIYLFDTLSPREMPEEDDFQEEYPDEDPLIALQV